MTHNHLSDYEIAINFGDTLQIIYKEKMAELNKELQEYYALVDKISIPQIPEWQREVLLSMRPSVDHVNIKAVEHIQKIRLLYKKIKSGKEFLNVETARNVPISKVYDFHFKGKNVSCPFHGEDKHPSASIKYNKLVCFVCNFKPLDSIGLFMKLNNVGFKEAVESLCKI